MDPHLIFLYASYAVIVIMSIVLHEIAHGWVAWKLGDDTAYLMGRISLNPIRHIDPFLTIVLPVMCVLSGMPPFGAAKPVPINPSRFRHYRRDDILVSVAGVAVNLMIAAALSLALRLALITGVFQAGAVGTEVLAKGILTNIVLCLFNLVPIPPLDGSHVLRHFLPWEARHVFDRVGFWGLILVFFVARFVPGFWTVMWYVILFIWHYVLYLPYDLFLIAIRRFA